MRTITGSVVSDKADKTIVISVSVRRTHPVYKKQYSVSKKLMAHDEKNEAKVGDLVEIVETAPISARKRFKLHKVLETAKIYHTEPEPETRKVKKVTEDDSELDK